MSVKLTLSLNEEIIKKAKLWAERHQTSLSQIVEKHFSSLVSSKEPMENLSPNTKALKGLFKTKENNLSYKELLDKYKGNG